jgi:hypothetical protein
MMTPAPSRDEAQQALHAVRQQQASLVRRTLAPLPAWYYLAGATLVILNGLAWDLPGPARWAVIAVIVAALIAMTRAHRRRAGAKARHAWWYQQFDDRTFWIFFLYIAALVLVQQTMTTIFTRTGLPWPSTLGGSPPLPRSWSPRHWCVPCSAGGSPPAPNPAATTGCTDSPTCCPSGRPPSCPRG